MHDILARDNIPLAVNQVEFSILRQLPEKSGLLEEMKKRNVTCLGCTFPLTTLGLAWWLTSRFALGNGSIDWEI
jgi:hypothetical protein